VSEWPSGPFQRVKPLETRRHRKTDFARAFNENARFKSFDEKYSAFSFSEFVFRSRHPASTGGAYRDRHDT
jgi:hypothetical protein